jgi:Fe-S oxidoreductase
MSMAYFAANESVEVAKPFAEPAWACTGCFGCREHCDHKNDVTGTLYRARDAFVRAGVAPEGAERVLRRFDERAAVLEQRSTALRELPEVDAHAETALLLGCAYARDEASAVARDAVRATSKLVAGPVALIDTCCGAPLLYAGDETRFVRQAEKLGRAIAGKKRVIVLDAGCASTMRIHHVDAGVKHPAPVEHFTELAAQELGKLGRAEGLFDGGPVRYHDPCQLGRGLGVYEAPRALLSRALGRAPDEFARTREDARCSGGGGILPVTMPETSDEMARMRLDEHDAEGGGTVVTACASSAKKFRKRGAKTVDIVTVVARALGLD